MGRFDKKELPFDKYKNNLLDYLRMQGIQAELGQVQNCPWHQDSTPSFSVFQGDDGYPAFNCFGCNRAGDIYKAVEYCTGETDAGKQFKEIDRIFGGGQEATLAALPRPEPQEKAPAFTPDPAAFARFTDWLKNQPNASDYILGYFSQRAQIKSEGYIHQYPQAILKKLVTYFFWYPGKKAAEQDLGKLALFAAGVPYAKKDESLPPEQRKIAWWHSGVLAKSPEGYKLLFMDGIESKKINPRAGVSYFPIPSELPEGKPVILMEGEIDAILCQASGIENAYSMGGKGGLTKERIKKYIVPKNIPEIILFADNDTDGGSQKKFGLLPITTEDHIRETVPENLIKMGYTGQIRVTVLPADCGFKDPDDAIRNNRLDLVQQAIADATPYVPQEKPQAGAKKKPAKEDTATKKPIKGTIYQEWDTVPLKFFKSLLKKFSYPALDPTDLTAFLSAAYKTCKEDGAIDALLSFTDGDYTTDQIKEAAKTDHTPFYLLELAAKYDVSKFIIQKLEELLVPAKEILRIFKFEETIVPIDYDKMCENQNFIAFMEKKDNFFAAATIADATDGNIIYVEKEKNHYAYTGVVWERLPGLAVEAHTMLQNMLLRYLEKNLDKKDIINKLLKQIGSRRFRLDLVKDFDEFRGDTYREDVMFDSTPIQATLTLQDGVLDFSGEKIRFRQATREEYRRAVLPYTVSQLKKAGNPDLFIRFLTANFVPAKPETLQRNSTTTVDTLLYYLSLIQSGNTQYKYGAFFLGHGGTGKSTLCSIIDAIYPNYCTQLQNEILVSTGKHMQNANGPTPEIAKLEGKLIAFVQETPKGGKLNTNTFKLLTGGDKLTARNLNRDPHEFFPTMQVVLSTNDSPDFEHGDDAAIKRMLIFRFTVGADSEQKQFAEKELKDCQTAKDFITALRPEFPAVIKYLAERYITLRNVHKGKIPQSAECINEKNLYVRDQEKDTDRFVKACIKFAFTDDNAFVSSKNLYTVYLNLLGIEEGSKEAATQRQFTTWLKSDYREFRSSYKQRRPDATSNPEWGFEHIALTEYGLSLLNKTADSGLPFTPRHQDTPPQQPELTAPPPTDDPFADPSIPPDEPLTDEDGNQIDIY